MANYSERLRSNTPVDNEKLSIRSRLNKESSSNTAEQDETTENEKGENFWQSYNALKNVFKKFKNTTVNRVNRRGILRTATDYIKNNKLISVAIITSILIVIIAVYISSPYAKYNYYKDLKGKSIILSILLY